MHTMVNEFAITADGEEKDRRGWPQYEAVVRGLGKRLNSERAFRQIVDWFVGGLLSKTEKDFMYMLPPDPSEKGGRFSISVQQNKGRGWSPCSITVFAYEVVVVDEPFPVCICMNKMLYDNNVTFSFTVGSEHRNVFGESKAFDLSLERILEEMLDWQAESYLSKRPTVKSAIQVGFDEALHNLGSGTPTLGIVTGSGHIK